MKAVPAITKLQIISIQTYHETYPPVHLKEFYLGHIKFTLTNIYEKKYNTLD